MPPQPAQHRRKSNRDQASPKPRASARGAHGAEIQNRSDESAVVPLEVTVQFRDLGQFRRRCRCHLPSCWLRYPRRLRRAALVGGNAASERGRARGREMPAQRAGAAPWPRQPPRLQSPSATPAPTTVVPRVLQDMLCRFLERPKRAGYGFDQTVILGLLAIGSILGHCQTL